MAYKAFNILIMARSGGGERCYRVDTEKEFDST